MVAIDENFQIVFDVWNARHGHIQLTMREDTTRKIDAGSFEFQTLCLVDRDGKCQCDWELSTNEFHIAIVECLLGQHTVNFHGFSLAAADPDFRHNFVGDHTLDKKPIVLNT